MLKVHISNGQTLSFDLRDDAQRAEWEQSCATDAFQQSITGVALLHNKTLHVLPLPKQFKKRHFTAGLLKTEGSDGERVLGEQVTCQADNVRMCITAYYTRTPKMVRFDVIRTGWQRHIGPKTGSMTNV